MLARQGKLAAARGVVMLVTIYVGIVHLGGGKRLRLFIILSNF